VGGKGARWKSLERTGAGEGRKSPQRNPAISSAPKEKNVARAKRGVKYFKKKKS